MQMGQKIKLIVGVPVTDMEEQEIDHYRRVWEDTDDLNGNPAPFEVQDAMTASGRGTKYYRSLTLMYPDAQWLVEHLEDRRDFCAAGRGLYTRLLTKIKVAVYDELCRDCLSAENP